MLEAFDGKLPQIAPDAFIHSAAVLIGEITIGHQTSVWPNVTLRGDDGAILIGDNTSIQDGCTIHATEGWSKTTVGSRVTVGHNSILHGCSVADDCLIGMGSIILDNAIIEAGAFVAAGTLIPPGKRVAAGTMVRGNPFTVVRECNANDRAQIDFSWQAYTKRCAQYLAARRAAD
jgi:carbonic anhydrase/acetyltransferase-like protein (isoleucine patch superfamily)